MSGKNVHIRNTGKDYDLGKLFEQIKAFCLVNIRLITRISIVVIAGFIILHFVHPPAIEIIEKHGFAKSSLTSALALVLCM